MEIASPVLVCTKEWWKKRSWAVQSLQIAAIKEAARKVPIGLLHSNLVLQTLNLKDCCAINAYKVLANYTDNTDK